ncbi:MAG TPA: protein phosphatase 2C domain-containing protein [Gammaproteobacteria bacterium]|nr:protein phosphatase 2C domain-containing protein [Gammaproteobacteria bacterium]
MNESRHPLRWNSRALSHVGAVRKNNEDSYLHRPDLGVWAVADGMGGHAAGDIASQTVVECLTQIQQNGSLSTLVEAAEDKLLEANRRLVAMAVDQQQRTIGSTAVALVARGRHVACLWAGDSRLYRVRGKKIERMTQDHAMVEDLVSSGLMSREEASTHPQANRITRAIGAMPGLFVDVELYAIEAGDLFVLCSDGLYKELTDTEIAKTLNGSEQAVDALINLCLERRARDNVTVIAVRFT